MDIPQDVAQVFISSVCDDRFVFEGFGQFSFGVQDTPMVVDDLPDRRLSGVIRGREGDSVRRCLDLVFQECSPWDIFRFLFLYFGACSWESSFVEFPL